MEKTLGLYLHIPFCKSKCAYCDFYSLPRSEEKMDAYTAALIRHLEEVAPRCTAHTVDTVYFGGGTPSYLGEKRLIKLLKTVKKRYHVAADAEITLEANPDSAEDWKTLRALRKAGFNRISLGAQAADDELLRRIGRVHTWEQVLSAVAAARMAGLENLSLDLIYGLPGQSLAAWQDTLRSAAALEPKHISCYGLKIEPGTPLWQQRQSADIPDDDTQADMYLWTVDYLKKHGYEQYEISNFAQPGYESRHNLKYWTLGEYAGFGPGAHSDMGGVRFAYERNLTPTSPETCTCRSWRRSRPLTGIWSTSCCRCAPPGASTAAISSGSSARSSSLWRSCWCSTRPTASPSGRKRAGA